MKRVTLKDIAESLDYHVSTISLALKNHPRIPETTRNTIQEKAKEMGYSPDPQLSALVHYRNSKKKKKHFEKIAFLTHWPKEVDWNQFYSHNLFYTGAKEMAESMGYRLEIFSLREEGMSARRMSDILISRGIRGILLSSIHRDIKSFDLDWGQFSSVRIDLNPKELPIHTIRNDQVQGIRLAVKKLQELGFKNKRIAFCLPSGLDEGIDHNWAMGYSWETRDWNHGSSIPVCHVEYENTEKVFLDWFLENRPEVILAESTRYAEILLDNGFSIPDDVGFVTLDYHLKSSFTGIMQDHKEVGSAAFNFLHGMILRNERGLPENPTTLLVPGRWIDGNSLFNSKTQ